MSAAPLLVGVTGHRNVPETGALETALEAAFARIEQAFPARDWVFLSSLAEGADQIVARYALQRPGTVLEVPLPLPEAEYLQSFSTTQGRQAFNDLLQRAARITRIPPVDTREEAFRQAGYVILDRCAALIALWDGLPPRGPGGTGEIVSEARRRRILLAWVHLQGGDPFVTFENFPES